MKGEGGKKAKESERSENLVLLRTRIRKNPTQREHHTPHINSEGAVLLEKDLWPKDNSRDRIVELKSLGRDGVAQELIH